MRALGIVVVLTLLVAGCGSSGELSPDALAKQAESLQSVAAEGALLGNDAAADRTTRIFTRVHSDDLEEAASQTETSLRTAKTQPALEPKLRRLTSLAADVAHDLNELGDAPKDEQRALAGELQSAADRSKQIAQGLK